MSDSKSLASKEARPTLKIIVISDYICVFCYIVNKIIHDAIKDCNDLSIKFDVEFRPFTLLCATSPNSVHKPSRTEYLKNRFGEQETAKKWKAVREMATNADLTLKDEGVVCRAVLAHRLAVKAYQVGGQEMQQELNKTIFHAAFEQGSDISDPDFLIQAAVKVGLMNEERAAEFLRSTECQDCVDKMIDAAKAGGVSGVPFVIIDGKWAISGVQRREYYTQVFRLLALNLQKLPVEVRPASEQ